MSDGVTFVALMLCAAGLGTATLTVLGLSRADRWEFRALSVAAGLGVLAVALGVLGLLGALKWAQWLVPIGAIFALVSFAQALRSRERSTLRRPSVLTVAAGVILGVTCLGGIAPVTGSDSLAYPIPIAQQLAREGQWQFWPHLARSVYPPSQQFLSAALIVSGNDRVGLITAAEFALAVLLVAMLAVRILNRPAAGWVASIVAFGCPAAAFLVGSAKEDLLVTVMTVAGAIALNLAPGMGSVAAVGLFAGLAAGAKYSGLPVAVGLVACVPFCCGRHRRFSSLALAVLVAVVGGGLWYGVNLARFGNPVVPLMPSVGTFPGASQVTSEWLQMYGHGRALIDFLFAPFRMTLEVLTFDAGVFGGRGNWVNPLAFLGIAWGLAEQRRRPAYLPLLAIAFALYVTWFTGPLQVARLLLPALALLAVPAADGLLWAWSRFRLVRYPIALVLALSVGMVMSVGMVRFARYASDPATFIGRETEYFAAIQWMNMHLDPARDRVATSLRASAYLRIPWMNLARDFQVEIIGADEADPFRLRAALQRQGFSHVFGLPDSFQEPPTWLVPVYSNPASRLGGAHFFRSPPVEAVTVFALK